MICKKSPPCSHKMIAYKMRKSRKSCCRKSPHKRIGPSRISKSPWLKFLHKQSGKGYTRKQLQKMYH